MYQVAGIGIPGTYQTTATKVPVLVAIVPIATASCGCLVLLR